MGDIVQDIELHPGEELPLVANFEDVLATGEVVSSGAAVAYNSAGGASPAGLLSGSVTVVSPRVQQKVTVGTGVMTGENYLVVLTATTDQGLDYVQRFLIKVVSLTTAVTVPVIETEGSAANSYVTMAEAETYFSMRLRALAWDEAMLQDRAKALLTATRDLEALTYRGSRYDLSFDEEAATPSWFAQPLAFPRDYMLDRDGAPYVAQEVKEAQCEQALFLLVAGSGADRRARLQAQGVQSFSVEGMSEAYRQDGGQWMLVHPWGRLCPDAQRLVARHVEWDIEVTRG